MGRFTVYALLGFIFTATSVGAQEAGPADAAPGDMVKNYLFRLSDEAFARRQAARDALGTPEQIAGYQAEMHEFFTDQLGGFWEKGPLNAQVVGTGERDGFRYEKVIYESMPGLLITGIVFLPLEAGPYPGVIVPCGHDDGGKACEAYQRLCILLARNGIAALIYDPIGQGERVQIFDEDGKAKYSCTVEHTVVGTAAIPLGWNAAKFRVWDGMRSIDYLASRPDIDPERIGCTGNSGGGTLTSYIMALDLRVKCAAPSCYITSQRLFFRKDGPQDAEQNIHGQIANGQDARGMEHADYVMMRAPRPTLLCAATRDFFNIEGTWDSFRDAKRLYTKLGFPERVSLVEADEEHGFTAPLRQGAARWMRRWLLEKDDAAVEQDAVVLTLDEARCTPDGQVARMPGARTVFDVMAEEEARLGAGRAEWLKSTPREQVVAKIRELTGIRALADLPEPGVETVSVEERDGYRVESLVLSPEEGIRLLAKWYVPKKAKGTELHVGPEPIGEPSQEVLSALANSVSVMALEVRGTGATAPKTRLDGFDKVFGGGWRDFFTAYMLDKTCLGMQAEDMMVCGRWLSAKTGGKVTLRVGGDGLQPAGLHAAALEPEVFEKCKLEKPAESWAETVRDPERPGALLNTVHGALRYYDIPDLERP
ncbi:MAG: prolyl oligopeptidase family serine peptidase [Candidatus Hydrogenedentes bacterium]|nr:prolyl oligopeptidase family serine peptidase [Candidatus Hydrogenedentota bacterium]